jgi:hypothetical protein
MKEPLMEAIRPLASEFARHSKKGHMPHLSPRPYLTLPVVVEKGAWKIQQSLTFGVLLDCLNIVANEIHHGGGAQQLYRLRRQSADRSHLLFELRKAARIERVMA